MAVIDLKNCTIKIKDGGANALVIKIGEGNLTWNEKRPRDYIKDRGILSTVRDGDQDPVEVRLSIIWEFIKAVTGSGTPTPIEAIKNTGEASSWVTADTDPCAPYAVKLEITNQEPCQGVLKETITISPFRYEEVQFDPKAFTFSVTGKANVTQATEVRS